MARSNWDTLALDQDGEPINGVFASPRGVVVHIYKNWLYIHDKEAWTEECGYMKPTIMEIHEGTMRYKDVRIWAAGGPQNGIYCVVWTPSYSHPDDEVVGMVGCGVYGYEGEEFVGVTQESAEFLHKLLTDKKDVTEERAEWVMSILPDKMHKEEVMSKLPDQVLEYVHQPTAFLVPDELREVNVMDGMRFNQGDAYFANRLGGNESNVATKIGEANRTMLSQALEDEEE